MDKFARGYRANKGVFDVSDHLNRDSHTLLIIKLPDSRVLHIVSRSLFLAMIILSLPSLGSIIRASSNNVLYRSNIIDSDNSNGFKILPILLRDLLDEGLIKKGQKGFVVGSGNREIEEDFEFLKDAGVDLLTGADLQTKNMFKDEAFDFVFSSTFRGTHLIDSVLKEGGLMISILGDNPLNELRLLKSYKIVYLRRFENTVAALRKYGPSPKREKKQILYGVTPEEKKAALKGLEDVFLEPPRRATLAKKSSFTSRKIKFLPDLLKDSLDGYPRRVFISDDSNAMDWFYKNYPMKDQEFEVYDMEVMGQKDAQGLVLGVSNWVMKNVKREDYVVMKAEAQVVEEMVKDGSLNLVDELFLECKNQWEEKGSKRAYWQCLALYGKVRDEGIAVHQWWN